MIHILWENAYAHAALYDCMWCIISFQLFLLFNIVFRWQKHYELDEHYETQGIKFYGQASC
jgi:hypothetical protein